MQFEIKTSLFNGRLAHLKFGNQRLLQEAPEWIHAVSESQTCHWSMAKNHYQRTMLFSKDSLELAI